MMITIKMTENKMTGIKVDMMIVGTREVTTNDTIDQSADVTTEAVTSAEATEDKTGRDAQSQELRSHFKKRWRTSAESICSKIQRLDD